MQVLQGAGAFVVADGKPSQYHEHVMVPDLSVGMYCIPVGGEDGQHPHTEPEICVARARS